MNLKTNEKNRLEIARVASQMIDNKMDLIEGCRRIVDLCFDLPKAETEDAIFFNIRGIESDTEDFPIGREKDQWEPEALKRKEQEKVEFLAVVKDDILRSCRAIIDRYSKPS